MTGHRYVTGEVSTLVSEVKAFFFFFFVLLGESAEVAIAVSSVLLSLFLSNNNAPCGLSGEDKDGRLRRGGVWSSFGVSGEGKNPAGTGRL